MKQVVLKQKNNMVKTAISAMCLSLFLITGIQAQIMDSENRVDVILKDGTHVVMYGKAESLSDNFTGEYYYLPTNLRLSSKPDGTKEFLFLKYTTEDAGAPQGALLHFLMEWGLTPEQEAEAQDKLREKIKGLSKAQGNPNKKRPKKKKDKNWWKKRKKPKQQKQNNTITNAKRMKGKQSEILKELEASKKGPKNPFKHVKDPKLLGAAKVYVEDGKSFRIISATLSDGSTTKVVASGNASTLPGGKIAVAAKLDKISAQLLAATFEQTSSITDISIELNFKYNLRLPAVRGRIVIDWEKVKTKIDSIGIEKTKKKSGFKWWIFDFRSQENTYNEARELYEEMIETQAVDVQIDNNTVNDDAADKVVSSFMNVFMEALSDKDMDSPPPPPTEEEKIDFPDIKYGNKYTYNKKKAEASYKRGLQVYNLNLRKPIAESFSITGNMASWYDGVRDNPKCVASVNLNDPFFQHRDINLILDLEAEEMFGKEVNYVTVNVRKRRTEGNDFQDQVTIDRSYLKDKGNRASLTYARGEDTNPDLYEYKMQWSLKGGQIFPPKPRWVKGDWEGVTLAPPVTPRPIELEGDLDELKHSNIVRASAIIRYYKFGEESEIVIPLTVSKGQPLITETIFTDRDTRGYAYRLIFTHKKEGKLALPWETKINDDYIYASIPEEFENTESEIFKEAKVAGKEIVKTTKNKVLDKFKHLIGKIVN